MKSSQLCLHLAASFLTFSVSCQSFGQVEVASALKDSEAKVEFQKKADQKSLLIDFRKNPLKSVKNPSVKSELRMGPGSGGGGNTCAFMLKQQTLEILEQIKYYPPFQQDNVADILEQNINAAQFHIADEDLFVDGKDVEAINFPLKKVVVIEQAFCDKMMEITSASLGTLLHEYLGLAGYDDTQYQISGDFVQSLNQYAGLNKVGVAGFANVHINRLRTKFRNTPTQFNVAAQFSYASVHCTYFSEVDGVLTNRSFRILRISDKNISIAFVDPKTNNPDLQNALMLDMVLTVNGLRAELPSEDSHSSSFIVFREDGQRSLVGEWSIIGKTVEDTRRMAKSIYPVAGLANRGSLAMGYSACAPKK